MNYIVRADFYPSGSILPLGITDECGNTLYIRNFEPLVASSDGSQNIYCETTNNKKFLLSFRYGKFYVTDMEDCNNDIKS